MRRLMHQWRQDLVDEWWSAACPARYSDLDLQTRRRKPPELSPSRNLLHHLLTVRSENGDYAAFHRRFKHEDASLNCVCGQETIPTHFIRCRRNAGHFPKLRKGLIVAAFTQQFLGPRGLGNFIEYARMTVRFGNVPVNLSSAGCERIIK